MNIETLAALAAKNLNESTGSLKGFRENHISQFKGQGLTSPVIDGYKFTPLETFFGSLSQEEKVTSPVFQKTEFPTITFIDGRLDHSDTLPPGVELKMIKDHFEEIQGKLTQSNALSHLHH